MQKIIFTLLFMCVLPAFAEEIKCPEESMLVDFVVSFSKERMQSCQKKVGDKYLKHGPEIIYNPDGSVKSKNYYLDDVQSDAHSSASSKMTLENQKNEIQKEVDQVLNILIEHVLIGASFSKKIDIIDGNGGCPDSAISRLQFVMKGVPYTNTIKFRRQCFFAGDYRYEFDKKLTATFKVDNVFGYDRVVFDYLISKTTKEGITNITTELLKGEFTSSSKKNFKFKAYVSYKLNLQEVVISAGKKGVEIETATVDIFEYNGQPLTYHRDVF